MNDRLEKSEIFLKGHDRLDISEIFFNNWLDISEIFLKIKKKKKNSRKDIPWSQRYSSY